MSRCRSCSADLPEASRFCLKCGARVSSNGATSPVPVDPAGIETVAMETPAASPRPTSVSRTTTALERHRFDPGSLLASRYRIISRIGKGGMGEVFRADDILLGQSVALKFLPESATGNLNLLKRFYDEVRIARQITHANVCRVYDVGEVDGQPYLSMEYIDGEDLASLLRRIGRLPSDKASEFARKMCAGLAAAHAQGVLHRDLKPGNIMIDGRGELRITDFGLAAVASELEGSEIRSGTPAYMAPEQLEGREVSVQSDLYALGLVFYEMFTGKQPHQANTVADILKLRKESTITNPSTLVAELDPAVENAIKRCLDPNPKERPVSAMSLAASLPGGDPLAAALAAGETPSPELVAASGSFEGLSPKVAIAALAGVAAGMVALCLLSPPLQRLTKLPLENPPEVLAGKAREILRSLGYTNRPVDFAYGFRNEPGYSGAMGRYAKGVERWKEVLSKPPSPTTFWYRESPRDFAQDIGGEGEVVMGDPQSTVAGMVTVQVDLDGRLLRFTAVPPQFEAKPPPEVRAPDWEPIFALARLDISQFKPDKPQWTPLAATDFRSAWTGTYPGPANLPVRVEAASFQGKPVFFHVITPWIFPFRAQGDPPPLSRRILNIGLTVVFLGIILAACVVARYNWNAGRVDKRGAVRVGVYMAALSMLVWLLKTHHASGNIDAEMRLFGEATGSALVNFFVYWVFYLALEPWVRRYWPQALVTWTRVLQGNFRDPMVGRDLLFGVMLGIFYELYILGFLSAVLRPSGETMNDFQIADLMGFRWVARSMVGELNGAISGALTFFLILFFLRALLRKQWIAAAVFVALWTAFQASRSGLPWYYGAGMFGGLYIIWVLAMLRFGFFATTILIFVINASIQNFATTDFTAWYGQSSWMLLAVLTALALLGFKLSLGGRPLFPGTPLARSG